MPSNRQSQSVFTIVKTCADLNIWVDFADLKGRLKMNDKVERNLFSHWGLLCFVMLSAGIASAVSAEEPVPSPFDDALTAPEQLPPRPDGSPPISNQELLDRLEETESQLRQLQGERSPNGTLLTAMQERLTQVRDPSITTVDQQTHGASTSANSNKKWFDRLSIRGYAQFRYNVTTAENDGSAPAHHVGDRSVGENQHFLIRRARVILSGDVSDHMYVYLQPDFATAVPGSPDANQFTQIRDWYGDLYIDESKVYRVRIGQSKVPYGWENLQSSSNRLPLDRSDPMNSAVRNERDLGVFFYWTPTEAQDLFKEVLDSGLKGSGNYGVFGIGVYNGQGGSFNEQNDDLHVVARLAVPYKFDNDQIVEWGLQAYTGKYTVLSSPIQALGVGPTIRPLGTLETGNRAGVREERIGGTLVYYPQSFGLQAEWNVGRGPGLTPDQTSVEERSLYGGYVMAMYRHQTEGLGLMFPFLRYNHFRGGYKAERNAPYTYINEWELGLEWQFNPQMELTTMYTITNRTNTVAQTAGESYRQFDGQLLRSQFQINY